MTHQEHNPEAKKCTATRIDGDPCGSYAQLESEYCVVHDPARTEINRAASQRGGSQTRYRAEKAKEHQDLDLRGAEDDWRRGGTRRADHKA